MEPALNQSDQSDPLLLIGNLLHRLSEGQDRLLNIATEHSRNDGGFGSILVTIGEDSASSHLSLCRAFGLKLGFGWLI